MLLNWRRSPLHRAGVLILMVGMSSAVLIWRHQDRIERENEAVQSADSATPLSPLDSRKHMRDMEIYSGKLGVLMERAGELFQGKALAKIIAFAAILASGSLFLLSAWTNPGECPDSPDESPTER